MAIEARELREPKFTVADRMRKAREVAGLEQSDLAAAFGISRQMISKWERGAQPRNQFETLERWAELTGVTAQWLAFGSPKMYTRDSSPFGVVAWSSDTPEPLTLPFDTRDPALSVVQ